MIRIVQNDAAVPAGLYGEALTQWGVATETVVLGDAPFPQPQPGERLILLGGYMSVHDDDRYPWLLEARAGLLAWESAGLPVLGICLGGQLLAAAGGAEVWSNRRGERGLLPISLTAAGVQDRLFAGIENPFLSMQWHNDSFDLPADAVHLATSDACPGQAFRVGAAAYGLQFHPELTPAIVAAWSAKLKLGDQHLAPFLTHQQRYRAASLKLLRNFLQLPAG